MTWDEVISDPVLQNLPFKIELNRFGQMLMSPANNKRGRIQFRTGREIDRRKNNGEVITECAIQTSDGVKVADVAWASDSFLAEHGDTSPYQKAPEICVEVVSPSNTKEEIETKVELYLARGALEVWVVNNQKEIRVYTHTGETKKSKLIPSIKL